MGSLTHLIKVFPRIFKKVINIAHTSSISNFAGEVNKNRITPIRHNPICQTLFLGYARYPGYKGLNLCATIWFDNENMHNMDPG